MAKSAAAGATCAFIFLLVAGSSMQGASSFQLIPDFLKCWYAVVELKGCLVNVIPSQLDVQFKFTEQCCKAVIGIEESCLQDVLSDNTFGSALLNLTSQVCANSPASRHQLHHKLSKVLN